MSTRRAKQHQYLVALEKKYHHRAGIHLHQHYKTRCKSLVHAVMVEPACEWHKREKQNPELAQELNDLFDFF